ncbi:HAD family hydrolase [Candidatus Xianfuyuplasma coldseepsis]|uniref:HAD-IB family hydrolase n=1 Tax=Candidatus Xianfuyuplasma coldseepsis TaxID=2782163 RepID=A0A7L7KRZ8_9MOLU|nr:haloacid dehalogenase-like hydrolase [Xianfuyuplasma coldseepsis]QMS84724.1 hypothetical protein G4Z02_02800 [Xianfuyuplasma coldseepsis]
MKLAIYDFDGTYVHIQTLPFLYKLWKSMKINQKTHRCIWSKITITYLFHKLHLCGFDKATFRSHAMALTADLFSSVDEETLNAFLQSFHDQVQPFISSDIKNQLKQDKQEGYHTVLLSGNFTNILQPFLTDGFDTVLGTSWIIDGKRLTSKEVDIIIHNKKRELIESSFIDVDYNNSKSYADSHYDLPILELVGEPVCVNPDKELQTIATSRNYRIWKI